MITPAHATDAAPPRPKLGSPAASSYNHHCMIGDDPAGAVEQAARFICRGIRRGQRVAFVAAAESRGEVVRALAAMGMDVAPQETAGALVFSDPADLTPAEGGADATGEACRGYLRRVGGGAAGGTCVVFDLGPVSGLAENRDQLAEWESILDAALGDFPSVAAVCLYDRSRTAADELDHVLRFHPTLVVGGRVFTNPFFEPDLADASARVSWKLQRIRGLPAEDEVNRIVAHDLRGPLHAISLATRMLREQVVGPRYEAREAEKYIDVIRRSADFMSRLVDDLLDVAKLEARELSVQPVPLQAHVLVADALEVYGSVAASRLQTMCVDVPVDLPLVLADRDRVLQVFSNLLGNAIKFTPEGGTIRVSAESSGHEVVFSVADSGPGIAPEEIGFLFDRYWQATHARRAGAGLGLAIAKGIVEAHGGRIWVESEPGRGTTFAFSLPAAG